MSKRISRDQLYMGIVDLVAQRGTCGRAQVGAVITVENRIVSMGYNGPLPDQPHCSSMVCDVNHTCERAVHAEMNAVAHAAKIGISLHNGFLYCSYSPCLTCARMIIQSGIIRVVFRNEYKELNGIWELSKSGVECVRFTG